MSEPSELAMEKAMETLDRWAENTSPRNTDIADADYDGLTLAVALLLDEARREIVSRCLAIVDNEADHAEAGMKIAELLRSL